MPPWAVVLAFAVGMQVGLAIGVVVMAAFVGASRRGPRG